MLETDKFFFVSFEEEAINHIRKNGQPELHTNIYSAEVRLQDHAEKLYQLISAETVTEREIINQVLSIIASLDLPPLDQKGHAWLASSVNQYLEQRLTYPQAYAIVYLSFDEQGKAEDALSFGKINGQTNTIFLNPSRPELKKYQAIFETVGASHEFESVQPLTESEQELFEFFEQRIELATESVKFYYVGQEIRNVIPTLQLWSSSQLLESLNRLRKPLNEKYPSLEIVAQTLPPYDGNDVYITIKGTKSL
ncbi:MAG TPA: hypothetical protein VD999_04840 [Vitreimonas sp.]|nr:hypothetical protein [Vitreimonas sp.]